MIELKSALASLFQSSQYSDLTIVCGMKRYPVHRLLLATRSTFFEGACRGGFREAETGVIDLTDDDAEAVEHMIHCKHLNNHGNPMSYADTPQTSITWTTSPRNHFHVAPRNDQPGQHHHGRHVSQSKPHLGNFLLPLAKTRYWRLWPPLCR
jgi:hypothetical protein